jgi:hypothetical protein
MERTVLVNRMRALCLVLLCYVVSVSADVAAQTTQRELVLVCGPDSNVTSVSNAEARKIFLGIPTTIDGQRLKPIRNATDDLINEVFLQKVVFMSKRSYERQLLSRVFRLGGTRPPEYSDLETLMSAILETPGALTYIWSDQIPAGSQLQTVGVLWKGPVQ